MFPQALRAWHVVVRFPDVIQSVEQTFRGMDAEGPEAYYSTHLRLPRTGFAKNVGAVFRDAADRETVNKTVNQFPEKLSLVSYPRTVRQIDDALL